MVVLALLAACSGMSLHAQAPPAKNPLLRLAQPWPDAEQMLKRKADAEALRLFAAEDPIALTLRGDFRTINRDRDPNSRKQYPAELTIARANGEPHTIPVTLGARGHVRRMARTCEYVPIRMTLPEEQLKDTVFEGQDVLKLVVQCRNGSAFEQYLLREYLAYRVSNAITPRSFRARQVSVSYVDPAGKPIGTRHGMLLEDDGDVAKRMEGRIAELPRALFANLEQGTLDTMMMFEYMIGSTDFSIYALHNVVLVQTQDRTLYPVPYDFDMTGLVSPPYAIPDKRLPIGSVKERLYRGPCRTLEQLEVDPGPHPSATRSRDGAAGRNRRLDQGFAGGSEELPRRVLLVDQRTEGRQAGVRGRLLESADDVISIRPASRRERTSAAISSMLMLFRHTLSLQGDRRWLSGPMHGLQEYPV